MFAINACEYEKPEKKVVEKKKGSDKTNTTEEIIEEVSAAVQKKSRELKFYNLTPQSYEDTIITVGEEDILGLVAFILPAEQLKSLD